MRGPIVRRARSLPLATVAVAALAVGCTESNSPTSDPATLTPTTTLSEAELQAATGRGIDGEFARLAKQVPGFGGMYYDQAGRLTVYVKESAAGARAADIAGRLRAAGTASVQRRLNASAAVITKAAKYDFAELQAYRARLKKIFSVRGVVSTATDEAENRLRIAIEPNAKEADVVRALARAGVPREAVIISRISKITALKTLQERFRPVPGGVQLSFPADEPGFVFVCTVGFNARIASRPGARFFVTNSHCSDRPGGDQDTRYFQPFPPAADRIAVEYRDPPFTAVGTGGFCYEGFRCRLSDALLARYNSNGQQEFGRIARTTFAGQRIGSLLINERNRRFTIVGEFAFPFLGEIAHKMGRTTGWTRGPVIETCGDYNSSGTDRVLICQDLTLAGVGGGDSGSPVFQQVGPDQVVLTGILWGGGTLGGAPVHVSSAMENIEIELGELATSN